MKQINTEETSTNWVLYHKVAVVLLLFVVLFSLPILCFSHSNEIPSFKYSREANENFQPIGHDGHKHSHDEHYQNSFSNYKKYQPTDMAQVWLYSMGSTLLISTAPYLLLFVIPLDNSDAMRPRLKVLLAFASGGLLGDAFLHLIPHATSPHHSHVNEHSHNHDHGRDIAIGLWVLGGIIAFLTVEKLVRLLKGGSAHSHGPSNTPVKQKSKGDGDKKKIEKANKKASKNDKIEISGYLNLAADFAHNFTDGLAIGASFLAGNSIGFVTTITILLHEVPHEIGDFAILIKSGCSRRKAMMLQLLTAIGALTGNVLALIGVGADANAAPWVLPFTAGGFIYIATVSVIPELLEETTKLGQSIREIAALLTGVALMVLIANFE